MQDLIKQEQFELEILDRLNSQKTLRNLVFVGGTMLRLCFGLNRFSSDLDFWIGKGIDEKKLYQQLKEYLSQFYTLKDSANKFYTILFEVKSRGYPRSLKIEIRKKDGKLTTESAIAYSKYSNLQVLVKAMSLKEMMRRKIESFIDRKEIRDVFDIEFLLKKGIDLNAPKATLGKILETIDSLTAKDYKVKLSSILEKEERKYYTTENFKILKLAISEKLLAIKDK